MSYQQRLEYLIGEGVSLRRRREPKAPRLISPWAAEAADLIAIVSGQDSELTRSAKEIAANAETDSHVDNLDFEDENSSDGLIPEMVELLRRTRDSNTPKPEVLDEQLRLKIIDKVFNSWWVKAQSALLTITAIFLVLGVIKIGNFQYNFDETVRAARAEVGVSASEAVGKINLKQVEVIGQLEGTVGATRAEAQEALRKIAEVGQDVDDLRTKLERRLTDDRSQILADLVDKLETNWKPKLDEELRGQRLLIQDAAKERIQNLNTEMAPRALEDLGIIREQYGEANNRLEKLSNRLNSADAEASQIDGTLRTLRADSEDLAETLRVLRNDLELLKKIQAGEGAVYSLISSLVLSTVALLLAVFALYRIHKVLSRE